jgi:hypothetical protein
LLGNQFAAPVQSLRDAPQRVNVTQVRGIADDNNEN